MLSHINLEIIVETDPMDILFNNWYKKLNKSIAI